LGFQNSLNAKDLEFHVFVALQVQIIILNSLFHSKSLRKELPINTYRDLTKTEEQEITDDLQVCVNYFS